MSEYMFLYTRSRLTSEEIDKLEAIAKERGAEFTYTGKMVGQSVTGWFSGPNLGYPFDKMLYDEVESDLKTCELIELF
jgi:hypothetical protein